MNDLKTLKALAYVSVIYGGFLLITYAAFCYSAVWQHEFLPIFPEAPRSDQPDQQLQGFNALNSTAAAANFSNASGVQARPRFRINDDPMATVFSLQAIAVLLTGMLFLVNGYLLLTHLHRKEHREIKQFVTSSLLTEEEKTVYDKLIKSGGAATQKQLTLDTGFSAVKTYRLIKRLEGKKIVKSFPYGMTNKIILNEA